MRALTENPSIQLLLACARAHTDRAGADRIRSLVQGPIDWEYFIETAQKNRVLPLVCQSLQGVCPERVPEPVMDRMRTGYLTIAARNLRSFQELLNVLKVFEENRIVAVPLKGPVLAEVLYGDLALRPFADLDILVYPEDAFKAFSLLLSCDYRTDLDFTEEAFNAYQRTEYGIEVMAGKGRLIIDLHWDAAGRYPACPFGLDLFGQRLDRLTLHGTEICQPPAEYLLIYQCLHGTKSCWSDLESVCSVAEIVRSRSEMDWAEVRRLARRLRCERIVALGLFLAWDLLGSSPPEPIFQDTQRDRAMRSMARKIYERLFFDVKGVVSEASCSDFSLFHIKARDSFHDRVRYATSLLFRPSRQEWRIFAVPANLVFLRGFLRVVRLLWGFACTKLKIGQMVV